MKISLLTDAPKHNLALMKLSTHHRQMGHEIIFNMPLFSSDYTYASVLFEKNKKAFIADIYGGPAFNEGPLSVTVEAMRPDYTLYGHDFSLGYTFRPCFRGCDFCKVPDMKHPDTDHHSIWDFHEAHQKKICLLNNNTFMDKQWRETFEEIWDADLTVIDENGYDLRLLDDEKADAIKKTRFQGKIHFAWDRMEDELHIVRGLGWLNKYKIRGHIYVLCGYDTSIEEDLYRCQILVDNGQDPFIMPYTEDVRQFKRFIDTFMWRKYKTIEQAWKDYSA